MMASEPVWIKLRSTKGPRAHAVYVAYPTGYWTFCGRFARHDGVKTATDAPTSRCRCCQSRLRLPYLVPDKIQALRRVEPLDVHLVAPEGLFGAVQAP